MERKEHLRRSIANNVRLGSILFGVFLGLTLVWEILQVVRPEFYGGRIVSISSIQLIVIVGFLFIFIILGDLSKLLSAETEEQKEMVRERTKEIQ